jgi:branched-chain amino acid transport system permease protein
MPIEPLIVIQAVVIGLLLGGVYGSLSMGLSVIFGVLKIINFAQADFMTLGMYFGLSLSLAFAFDPVISFFVAIPLFLVLGIVIERIAVVHVIDKPDTSQLLMTLGLSIILQNVVLTIWGPNFVTQQTHYRAEVLQLGPFFLSVAQAIAFGLSVLVGVTLTLVIYRTDFGRVVRATVNDRDAALLVGINVRRVYVIMFGVGIALAGAAGVLLAMYYPMYPTVGNAFILVMFLSVMLGGLGNILGSLLAGMAIGIVQSVFSLLLPNQLTLLPVYILFLVALIVPTPRRHHRR